LVAGAIKVYSWKNDFPAIQGSSRLLTLEIRQKKRFTIKSLEKCLGYDRDIPCSKRGLTESEAERPSKQAYYYLAKFLKEKFIIKTNKYERQKNSKPLITYEIVK
jgi:hypothetical protein